AAARLPCLHLGPRGALSRARHDRIGLSRRVAATRGAWRDYGRVVGAGSTGARAKRVLRAGLCALSHAGFRARRWRRIGVVPLDTGAPPGLLSFAHRAPPLRRRVTNP